MCNNLVRNAKLHNFPERHTLGFESTAGATNNQINKSTNKQIK